MLKMANHQKIFGRNGIVKTGSSPMTPVIIDNQIIIGTTRPAMSPIILSQVKLNGNII